MASRAGAELAVGDLVATYYEPLQAWVAAQVTAVDVAGNRADILELDWIGSEPPKVSQLADASSLRFGQREVHTNVVSVLPRNYRVIGNAPLLRDGAATMYGTEWEVGNSLSILEFQRRGKAAVIELDTIDNVSDWLKTADRGYLQSAYKVQGDVSSLDCRLLAESCPKLTVLSLVGSNGGGELLNAPRLNDLASLRSLQLNNFLRLSPDDCPDPTALRQLEYLWLRNIPKSFVDKAKCLWNPERRNGTWMSITLARSEEWIAANSSNPFRDWGDRSLISAQTVRKAVAIYSEARRAALATLGELSSEAALVDRCAEIGVAYADAFNQLNARRHWIETMERDEIMTALGSMLDDIDDPRRDNAQEALDEGADEHREW